MCCSKSEATINKVLIHACCADCLLKMMESIKAEKNSEVVVYFYNPNIHPRSEYQSRLKAMKLMIGDLKMIIPDWKPSDYFEKVENSKKPERCIDCWNLRLEQTAKFASENGFEAFSSTLLTSEYQNSKKIEEIGKKMGKKYKIDFFVPKKVCKKLETKGFYKQVFCGCCYSLTERFKEKF